MYPTLTTTERLVATFMENVNCNMYKTTFCVNQSLASEKRNAFKLIWDVGSYSLPGLIVCCQGAKQRMTELEKKGKSYMQLRKIRQFDEEFDTKTFPDDAQEIYIKANKLLEK